MANDAQQPPQIGKSPPAEVWINAAILAVVPVSLLVFLAVLLQARGLASLGWGIAAVGGAGALAFAFVPALRARALYAGGRLLPCELVQVFRHDVETRGLGARMATSWRVRVRYQPAGAATVEATVPSRLMHHPAAAYEAEAGRGWVLVHPERPERCLLVPVRPADSLYNFSGCMVAVALALLVLTPTVPWIVPPPKPGPKELTPEERAAVAALLEVGRRQEELLRQQKESGEREVAAVDLAELDDLSGGGLAAAVRVDGYTVDVVGSGRHWLAVAMPLAANKGWLGVNSGTWLNHFVVRSSSPIPLEKNCALPPSGTERLHIDPERRGLAATSSR